MAIIGLRIPGFVKIHWRYIKNGPLVWLSLFLAPFFALQLVLTTFFETIAKEDFSIWIIRLCCVILVSLLFYFSERNRIVRQFYVYFVPILIAIWLLYGLDKQGGFASRIFVFKLAIIGLVIFLFGHFTSTKGEKILSEGADKDFADGWVHYKNGEYEEALNFFEKSAAREHFKSLFMIGDAYEYGNFYAQSKVKAAEYYWRSSKRGYPKATERYGHIIDAMTDTEKEAHNTELTGATDVDVL